MPSTRLLSAMLLLLASFGAPDTSLAQDERAQGPTPPRLARMNGEVSFWRPGADDWAPAQINTALAAGDRLFVASGGEALVEIVSRAEVRVAGDTELGVASLETGYLQLEIPSGRAALDLQRLPDGQRIEVDTPNGAFMIDRAGYYRVDVADDTVFTVRRGGEATVIPADGEETTVREGEQVVLRGTESASIVTNRAPAPDEWDAFNEQQYASRPARAQSAQYIPPDVAGADDLDRHGEWRSTPDYGQVWVPRDVGPDWAPYTTGRWTYDPYYEWTWVDDAPWGWAPYHYGRWVNYDSYWGWAPGPVIAQPVYAPALVGFVGAPGINVSVNIGAPFFGWTALGWGEPCLPWWGPRGFRGRPYWGGWGGRRYVNNVYVDNRRIVNVNDIRRYRNFDARNGVVGVGRDRFGRGRNDFVRLGRNDVDNLQPIRGTLGVRPASTSLVGRDGRGRRPPERMRNRTVVGTRAPQDTSRRLQRAGLRAPAPEQRGPQTRLTGRSRMRVREQDQRAGGRDIQRGDRRQDRADDRLGGRAAERRQRQALRGDAPPPPPRADRRERAQGPNGRFGQDGGRAMRRDRRDDVDANRQATRERDRGGDLRNGRNERGDTTSPNPRQQRRDRRDGELTTTPPPNIDRRDAERRASRGRDRRGDSPEPPRAERAPQAERRQTPPRADRQQRNRDVQQPRAQRERELRQPGQPRMERQEPRQQRQEARQPRMERQERRQQERIVQPRREAPRPRVERRPNQEPRQQRMAPSSGNARRERPEPPRASSVRPEFRQQAPRGGGGGDGGRRGGQGGGGRERGGGDRGERRQREG